MSKTIGTIVVHVDSEEMYRIKEGYVFKWRFPTEESLAKAAKEERKILEKLEFVEVEFRLSEEDDL